MLEFNKFVGRFIANYEEIVGDHQLFATDVDRDELWNLYLDSFPEGTNPIYIKRREFDCSCCRNFFKKIMHTVWIDSDWEKHSLFDFDVGDPDWQQVLNAVARKVESANIVDVFRINSNWLYGNELGNQTTRQYDPVKSNDHVKTWNHFYLPMNSEHVFNMSSSRITLDTFLSRRRSQEQVFRRTMDEISLESIDTVLELIASNTLYRGKEWEWALKKLRSFKDTYSYLPDSKKEAFCWKVSSILEVEVSNIRNHSIGTLLIDISEGRDLENSVTAYERIVAPANYKRPKAIFTQKMLDQAKQTVMELGYMDSLPRRFATVDDIPVKDMLFVNRNVKPNLETDPFSQMSNQAVTQQKSFDGARKISAQDFIENVLPTTSEVSVYLKGNHEKNLCSLIAPVAKNAPSMFKWDNGFSWAYNGNLASSDIRENVRNAGGKVDGSLRFSIQWNEDGQNDDDLDAHAKFIEHNVEYIRGNVEYIYYGDMKGYITRGELDVDVRHPNIERPGKPAVENIIYPKGPLKKGMYCFFVRCYDHRGGTGGFRAEIEFNGQIYRYDYTGPMQTGRDVAVADVVVDEYGKMSIRHYLTASSNSKTMWNVKCNTFVPVKSIFYSPNHWGDNHVGAKHLMFMLDGCINPDTPNGFYNEFLKNELLEHKRVFEALGNQMSVGKSYDQLSGIGFNLTERTELTVKVKGATTQVLNVIV